MLRFVKDILETKMKFLKDLEAHLRSSFAAYPAEDVFNLINGVVDYNNRNGKGKQNKAGVIRRPAGDNWF